MGNSEQDELKVQSAGKKKSILGEKKHTAPLEGSFLDVSSESKISEMFLGTLISHGTDI